MVVQAGYSQQAYPWLLCARPRPKTQVHLSNLRIAGWGEPGVVSWRCCLSWGKGPAQTYRVGPGGEWGQARRDSREPEENDKVLAELKENSFGICVRDGLQQNKR